MNHSKWKRGNWSSSSNDCDAESWMWIWCQLGQVNLDLRAVKWVIFVRDILSFNTVCSGVGIVDASNECDVQGEF